MAARQAGGDSLSSGSVIKGDEAIAVQPLGLEAVGRRGGGHIGVHCKGQVVGWGGGTMTAFRKKQGIAGAETFK